MTTFIVKNGSGGFVECHEAFRLGYDFNGYNLFAGGFHYTPFEVEQVKPEDLLGASADEAKVFRTETGGVYKALELSPAPQATA